MSVVFFFQAEDGIRDLVRSRGLGDVYKRQILLLEQTRHLGLGLIDELKAIMAMVLLLEVIGPVVTQRALIWAGEAARREEA